MGVGANMGLKDEIAAIKAKAAREQDESQKENSDRRVAENEDRDNIAVAAILDILSDDSVKQIIGVHASKPGNPIATIGIHKKSVALMRMVAANTIGPGEKLDMTFDAYGIVAGQLFGRHEVLSRIDELQREGINVVHKYDVKHDVLTITFDYTNA